MSSRRGTTDLRILSLDPPAWHLLLGAVGLGLLATVGAVLQADVLSRTLAGAFLQHRGAAELAGGFVLLVVVAALRGGCLFGGELAAQRAASRVKNVLRSRLISRVLAGGPMESRQQRTGELASVAGEGVESLDAYLGQALPQLILGALSPVLVFGVLLWIDPLTALALLLVAPFVPLLTVLIGARTKDLVDRRWRELGRMSAHFLDMLQGLPTLKLFGQSRAQLAGIDAVSRSYERSSMDVLRVAFQSSLVLDLSATMGVALVAVEVGTRLLLRSLPFDRSLFLLLLAPELFQPLRQIGLARHARLSATAAADRIFTMLDSGPQAAGAAEPVPLPRIDEIRIEGLGYRPTGRDEPVLQEVSLSLRRGCLTALRGPSGAGKTMVANALLRFIEPDHGEILVNGRPLAAWAPTAWRQKIAWAPQLPHLFSASVAENIRLGKPEATPEEVRQAAVLARADGFIHALPEGYDTQVGEHGARLSGGQRQRLALARAFILDRPVVILDEPTAHLDEETAARVRAAILTHCRDRLSLIITHDEQLGAMADEVVVFRAGRTAVLEAAP